MEKKNAEIFFALFWFVWGSGDGLLVSNWLSCPDRWEGPTKSHHDTDQEFGSEDVSLIVHIVFPQNEEHARPI